MRTKKRVVKRAAIARKQEKSRIKHIRLEAHVHGNISHAETEKIARHLQKKFGKNVHDIRIVLAK